jgi:hypothetical protein
VAHSGNDLAGLVKLGGQSASAALFGKSNMTPWPPVM